MPRLGIQDHTAGFETPSTAMCWEAITAVSTLLQLRQAVSEGWTIPLFCKQSGSPLAQHLHLQVCGNKGEEKEIELWFHKTVNLVLDHPALHNTACMHVSFYQFQSVPKSFSATFLQKTFWQTRYHLSVSSFISDCTVPVALRLS